MSCHDIYLPASTAAPCVRPTRDEAAERLLSVFPKRLPISWMTALMLAVNAGLNEIEAYYALLDLESSGSVKSTDFGYALDC